VIQNPALTIKKVKIKINLKIISVNYFKILKTKSKVKYIFICLVGIDEKFEITCIEDSRLNPSNQVSSSSS